MIKQFYERKKWIINQSKTAEQNTLENVQRKSDQ